VCCAFHGLASMLTDSRRWCCCKPRRTNPDGSAYPYIPTSSSVTDRLINRRHLPTSLRKRKLTNGACTKNAARDSAPCTYIQYIWWSDATVICGHITISMLCGNTTYFVKLSGEDLSRYSNKIESVGLRKYPYCHYITTKTMSQWQTFLRVCPTSWLA